MNFKVKFLNRCYFLLMRFRDNFLKGLNPPHPILIIETFMFRSTLGGCDNKAEAVNRIIQRESNFYISCFGRKSGDQTKRP